MATIAMVFWALVCYFAAGSMVRIFTEDADVVAVGSEYLRIVCWTFIASGIIFVSSSMFQAMGNTLPPLIASFSRVALVAVPAILMTRVPGFSLRWIWYLSAVSVAFQLAAVLWLLQREYRVRLTSPGMMPASATTGTR